MADIIFKQTAQQVRDFKSAQLPEKMPFVYIDAYHCKVKDIQSNEDNSNGIATIYTVIGIDFEAKKQVLGYYVTFGHKNKGTWIKIFNDLLRRKLSRVMMFISDDFSGISDAIKSVYPFALTQKCLVHFFRNFHRNLPSSVSSDFITKVKNIRDDSSASFDEAVSKFENICNSYRDSNETFIDYILSKKQEYWQFMKFDSKIRKYINNTNVVENFNSVLERIRISIGGYFQSIDVAEKSVFLIVNQLHNNIWDKPNPRFKHAQHDIR